MKILFITIGLLIVVFGFIAFVFILCRSNAKRDEAANQIFDNELKNQNNNLKKSV